MLPEHFIDRANRSTTSSFREYASPLIGGPLNEFSRLIAV
jgi:hypothetical protein